MDTRHCGRMRLLPLTLAGPNPAPSRLGCACQQLARIWLLPLGLQTPQSPHQDRSRPVRCRSRLSLGEFSSLGPIPSADVADAGDLSSITARSRKVLSHVQVRRLSQASWRCRTGPALCAAGRAAAAAATPQAALCAAGRCVPLCEPDPRPQCNCWHPEHACNALAGSAAQGGCQAQAQQQRQRHAAAGQHEPASHRPRQVSAGRQSLVL